MVHSIETGGKVGAIFVALLVLAVVPLYLFVGQPSGFVLGIPVWGWLLFVIHFVMLGLVVLAGREFRDFGSHAGVGD